MSHRTRNPAYTRVVAYAGLAVLALATPVVYSLLDDLGLSFRRWRKAVPSSADTAQP